MSEFLKSAILRKIRRDRAKGDILYFAQYYLPHLMENKSPVFHKEIVRLLGSENRLCIAAPRGFAKSTIVNIIYGIYCLLYNDGDDILSISQSSQMAEDWIRKIKFELEGNEKLKDDFGAILQWGEKESKRWTSDHLVVQKDNRVFSQIRARGRGCQVRGLRPTRVFCDDLEDDELVRSDEQRKIMKEWFLGALLNVIKFDQQLVVIGTILHPLALLNDIIKMREQFSNWTVRKYKAINGDKSLWEDRFPMEDLLRRKFEIGTYAFETEFQNNPISSDICLWRPGWILTYKTLPRIKFCFVALDPAASSKESADFSAMVCLGVSDDNKIYELGSVKGRWGTWDLIDRCIQFYLKYKPLRFGIEEVAFQSILRKVLVREATNKGVRIPVEPITLGKYTGKEKQRKSPKDKYTRALGVIHYFEQGAVYLKSQELIDQLSVFPTGSEDDLVDACVYSLMMIQKYSPIRVMVKEPTRGGIKGFTVKDKDKIPPMATIEELFETSTDWKIG